MTDEMYWKQVNTQLALFIQDPITTSEGVT